LIAFTAECEGDLTVASEVDGDRVHMLEHTAECQIVNHRTAAHVNVLLHVVCTYNHTTLLCPVQSQMIMP